MSEKDKLYKTIRYIIIILMVMVLLPFVLLFVVTLINSLFMVVN